MQGDLLPAAHAHPHVQPLEAVAPLDALLSDGPVFAAEQFPDPPVAEAWPRTRQVFGTEPLRGLILRSTRPTRRRACEQCPPARATLTPNVS